MRTGFPKLPHGRRAGILPDIVIPDRTGKHRIQDSVDQMDASEFQRSPADCTSILLPERRSFLQKLLIKLPDIRITDGADLSFSQRFRDISAVKISVIIPCGRLQFRPAVQISGKHLVQRKLPGVKRIDPIPSVPFYLFFLFPQTDAAAFSCRQPVCRQQLPAVDSMP